jgi:hypothetical protein
LLVYNFEVAFFGSSIAYFFTNHRFVEIIFIQAIACKIFYNIYFQIYLLIIYLLKFAWLKINDALALLVKKCQSSEKRVYRSKHYLQVSFLP